MMMISYNSPKKKSSDAVLQGVTIRVERRKTFFFVFPSFCFFLSLWCVLGGGGGVHARSR